MLTKIVGICVLAVSVISSINMVNVSAADTESSMVVIHNSARPVKDEGPIMHVDRANGQIIIKEIPHVVGQFVLNEKVHTTRLVDAKGNEVDLDCFEKGQWVTVHGYRVAESKVFLKTVQAIDGTLQKEKRTIEKVKTIGFIPFF
jgi:hypothetical protein